MKRTVHFSTKMVIWGIPLAQNGEFTRANGASFYTISQSVVCTGKNILHLEIV